MLRYRLVVQQNLSQKPSSRARSRFPSTRSRSQAFSGLERKMPHSRLPSPGTVSTLLILVTVFHASALILTSFRLWFRYHIRRLWWDDFWAALALLCDAVCMVALWIHIAPLDNPYINIEALPTPAQSRSVHIIAIWLNMLFYTCSIWFARMSIIFSMLRIIPPSRNVSMTACATCGLFVCMWAYMFTSKSVVCSTDRSWYNYRIIRCPLPKWVALSQVCTDASSDVILVALPLRLLWREKLPSHQRIMVLSVFSTSILVSVVSAVHTVYVTAHVIITSGFVAHVEIAVSLIVCNLLVVVTFFSRVFRNAIDLTPSTSDKTTGPSNRLTTVDLDFSGGSQSIMSTTGTGLTGTNISSIMLASTSDKSTTFSSVIASGGSTLPTVTVSTDTSPPPITASQ